MLKAELTQIAGFVCATALFSTSALTFPFAAIAQNASPNPTPSPTAVPITSAGVSTQSATVTLRDGTSPARPIAETGATVAEVLKNASITLGKSDRVSPAITSPVNAKTVITITRVHFVDAVVTRPIPFQTVFQMSKDVPPGTVRQGHAGVPGVLTLTYRTGYVNDKPSPRWLVSSVVTKHPVNQQTLGGIRVRMAQALPSRAGTYNRLRAISMVATGYSPYEGSSTGRCATGMRAGYGVVAVDPRVIPLGSHLYVEGYGYAVAGDTGGAIRGRRIDLGNTTYREAAAVGRQHVKVWVIAPSR